MKLLAFALALLLASAAQATEGWGQVRHAESYHTANVSITITTVIVPTYEIWSADDPGNASVAYLFQVVGTMSTENPEFVVVQDYFPGTGHINVFGWSCTPSYPCDTVPPVSQPECTSPCYVLVDWPFQPQHLFNHVSKNGSLNKALRVRVAHEKSGSNQNFSVALWNKNSLGWDTIWSHTKPGAPVDCFNGGCDVKGPWIEVSTIGGAGCVTPPIEQLQFGITWDATCVIPKTKTMGFDETTFQHDNGLVYVTTSNSLLALPPNQWLDYFFKFDHYAWEFGNIPNPKVKCPVPSQSSWWGLCRWGEP